MLHTHTHTDESGRNPYRFWVCELAPFFLVSFFLYNMAIVDKPWARLALNIVGFISNCYGFSVVGVFPPEIGFGGIFQVSTMKPNGNKDDLFIALTWIQFLTMIGLSVATLAFALKILRFAVPGALEGNYACMQQ